MNKLIVGWLSWITEENFDRRNQMVKSSASSLSFLTGSTYDVVAINNGGMDNIKSVLSIPDGIKIINLKKNYIDIAAIYSPYVIAHDKGYTYFCYLYDDFIITRDVFEDCIEFMEKNQEISCMRLPVYKTNDRKYDRDYTPKSVNPDAVCHRNGAGSSIKKTPFEKSGPVELGNSTFYHCNWRPISRPTLWRTKSFEPFASLEDKKHPVMQSFEQRMFDIADRLALEGTYKSSYLEGGMCKTFPVETSERTRVNPNLWSNYNIDMTEFCEDIRSSMGTR